MSDEKGAEPVSLTGPNLKYKYRSFKPRSRYHSSFAGNNRQARQHRQLTEKEKALHAAQPKVTVFITAGGKRVKVRERA